MVTRRTLLLAAAAAGAWGLKVTLRNHPQVAITQARALGFTEGEIYNDNFAPSLADQFSEFRASRPTAASFRRTPPIRSTARRWGPSAKPRNTAATTGSFFFYHSGQDTAATVLRVIEDVGGDNQRVGLDTANPVTCGTGDPVNFVEVLGRYLSLVNFKDGLFPSDGRSFGKETPIGKGKVRFRELMLKLKEVGYTGPLLIEREISGPQFVADIRAAKAYLEQLMAERGLA